MSDKCSPVLLQINTVANGVSPVAGIMRDIHSGALERGFDAHIVAGYGSGEGCDMVMESGAGRYRNALLARLRGNDGFGAKSQTRRLLGFISELKPDIVHLHNAHGYYLNLPMLRDFLKAKNIPLLVSLHDHWWLTGRCATPGARQCTRYLDDGCAACPHRDIYPATWFAARSYGKNTDGITFVAPSRQLAVPFHARIIPNGVDMPGTVNMKESESGKKTSGRAGNKEKTGFALAVALRWTPGKDPGTLLRLAPHLGMPLTIVGRLPRGTRLPDGVTNIPGPVSRDELIRLYSEAAVLLSTSRSEAFGMTVAEALLCGTPVVVRSGTAPEELLTDEDGIAVPFSDPVASAAAVREALRLRPTASLVSSVTDMQDAYCDVYRSLL